MSGCRVPRGWRTSDARKLRCGHSRRRKSKPLVTFPGSEAERLTLESERLRVSSSITCSGRMISGSQAGSVGPNRGEARRDSTKQDETVRARVVVSSCCGGTSPADRVCVPIAIDSVRKDKLRMWSYQRLILSYLPVPVAPGLCDAIPPRYPEQGSIKSCGGTAGRPSVVMSSPPRAASAEESCAFVLPERGARRALRGARAAPFRCRRALRENGPGDRHPGHHPVHAVDARPHHRGPLRTRNPGD
jgi:hypothetical protein